MSGKRRYVHTVIYTLFNEYSKSIEERKSPTGEKGTIDPLFKPHGRYSR